MMKIALKTILTQTFILVSLSLFAQNNTKTGIQKELCQTKTDSADFEIFKKYAENQISKNQQKITLLRTKKLNGNLKESKKFNAKIIALEKKNNELKKRINECTKLTSWLSFKSKFARDMKELG